VLDGLTATTHWRATTALAREHPAVAVNADAIYLRQGRIWTSGGVTAGIDLALALVEADHGSELAQQIARELLVFVRRPGGQSQFAAPAWAPPAGRPAVRTAQDLIHADPAADLRVPEMARRVGMSVRHFTREFTRAVGRPPAEYVEQVRVDAARRLLESEPVLVTVAAARPLPATFGQLRRDRDHRPHRPPDPRRPPIRRALPADARRDGRRDGRAGSDVDARRLRVHEDSSWKMGGRRSAKAAIPSCPSAEAIEIAARAAS